MNFLILSSVNEMQTSFRCMTESTCVNVFNRNLRRKTANSIYFFLLVLIWQCPLAYPQLFCSIEERFKFEKLSTYLQMNSTIGYFQNRFYDSFRRHQRLCRKVIAPRPSKRKHFSYFQSSISIKSNSLLFTETSFKFNFPVSFIIFFLFISTHIISVSIFN